MMIAEYNIIFLIFSNILNRREINVNNSNEQLHYEIELILNENLYQRNIITEDIYKKVNEQLLQLIEGCKMKNKILNSRY